MCVSPEHETLDIIPQSRRRRRKREEEEEEITTAMQSSTAMHQSCTRGPRQLSLSSNRGKGAGRRGSGGGGGQDHNCNAVSATMQQSCTHVPWQLFFFPVNKEDEEKRWRKR